MSQKLERFHKYLNLYQKLVKANAGNFVDEKLAEDVTQETYIKMYEHLDYLEDDRVKNWLIVVSGNIAKDYLKKGGNVFVESMAPNNLLTEMEDRTPSAEESFEEQEKQKAALELYRTACNLLYEKNPNWYFIMIDSRELGMTSAQIAEVLNTTVANVDVMRSRAREFLRKKLGDKFNDLF